MALKLNLKKDELISVAVEMGLEIPSKAKIIDLKKLIESSAVYKNDIEFVRSLVENALEKSKQETEKNEREADIQLEKLNYLRLAGTGEYFPPHQFTCRNCGGGDRGCVAIYRPFGEVSLSLNRTVTCMVLKANDRRTSCPCHDEFRGPRSDYVRQVALATTTTTNSYNRIERYWSACSYVLTVSKLGHY
ncbi:uncharacterized protein TNCV_2977711 [Trichonephila clavipes]|nr:uncharacterized protein TNCV_2977711 [Trichonephila clavipes]